MHGDRGSAIATGRRTDAMRIALPVALVAHHRGAVQAMLRDAPDLDRMTAGSDLRAVHELRASGIHERNACARSFDHCRAAERIAGMKDRPVRRR